MVSRTSVEFVHFLPPLCYLNVYLRGGGSTPTAAEPTRHLGVPHSSKSGCLAPRRTGGVSTPTCERHLSLAPFYRPTLKRASKELGVFKAG